MNSKGTTVEKSRKAFDSWRHSSLEERKEYLSKIRRVILEDLDPIVKEIAEGTGKADSEVIMSDILPTLEIIKYYEENGKQILSKEQRKTPRIFINNSSHVEYKPIGVVLVISPWNFPLQLSLVPAITALAAGNTVILKPSSKTSFIGETIGRIIKKAGFPENVLQVVQGKGDKAQQLIKQKPDKIFLTGSVSTGKKVMKAASENLIPVELELGGKDPMIIFEDADLERAAGAAVYGAFANAGQFCVSIERLYLQESIHDEFIEKVLEKTNKLRIGKGKNADVGAIISEEQIQFIEGQIDDAVKKGAKLLTKRKRQGLFLYPQVIVNANHEMRVMTEETFGPVLPIMKFKNEEQAIQLANDSDYGLNSSIWTKDIEKAERVVRALETGNAYINDVIKNIGNPYLPFGGAKNSGIGMYHGPEGLKSMSQQCSIMKNPNKGEEPNWFPYSPEIYDMVRTLVETNYGEINPIKKTKNYIQLYKQIKKLR